MHELKTFESDEFGQIRTLLIDGEPWFVGKDIASILKYSNTRKALADHVDKTLMECTLVMRLQTL